MKKIKSSTKSFYLTILKEYLIDSISKSRFKNKIIYEDLENLSIYLKEICVNTFNINKMFKEIFRHYKEITFKILDIKSFYHETFYQEYLVKIETTYKSAKWVIPIKVIKGFSKFPNGSSEIVYLSKFKRKQSIEEVTKIEKLVFNFYKIISNILVNNELLLNFYKLYIENIIKKKISLMVKKLYESKNEEINFEQIDNNFKNLKINKKLKYNWDLFMKKEKLEIQYNDILCAIELILKNLRKDGINE